MRQQGDQATFAIFLDNPILHMKPTYIITLTQIIHTNHILTYSNDIPQVSTEKYDFKDFFFFKNTFKKSLL